MFCSRQLHDLDQRLQNIYLIFKELSMIDFVPETVQPFNIVVFNEHSYMLIINSLVTLLKKHNRLLDIMASYHLNPFGEITVNKLYFDDKGSNLNMLIDNYQKMLICIDTSVSKIDQIMELNKFIGVEK